MSITDLMQRLSLNEESMPILLKVKALIAGSSLSSLKNVVQAPHLLYLLNCLNSNDSEQVEVSCYILSTLFPIVDPIKVAKELGDVLRKVLDHPNPAVQCLVLGELNRIAITAQGANALSESPELINRSIILIGHDEMSVALSAVKFLSAYGSSSVDIAKQLLGHDNRSSLQSLLDVMTKSDEIRYRVFELVCKIQSVSPELLNLCVESGIVDELIKDLSGNDVLLRVTCCAMLADMASAQHSIVYMEKHGVVSLMVDLLKKSSSEPFANLYVPAIIRFFGNLCFYCGPIKVIDLFPNFCSALFEMLESGEQSNQQIAVETIGIIGKSAEGKVVLANQGNSCIVAIKHICQLVQSAAQDIRLHAVNAMCQLIDLSLVDEIEMERIESLTLSWFMLLSSDPIDSVLALCKQPFTNIKCAGLHLLKTIAGCKWGMEAMVEVATFTEYLLDRSTETEKECKEAKYDVVKILCQSNRCSSIFGNQNYLKFRQYVNEGPFYVEVQTNIAIEDA